MSSCSAPTAANASTAVSTSFRSVASRAAAAAAARSAVASASIARASLASAAAHAVDLCCSATASIARTSLTSAAANATASAAARSGISLLPEASDTISGRRSFLGEAPPPESPPSGSCNSGDTCRAALRSQSG
eukprot:scaffold70181_cov84-Phaeocystis_antarctica.AAC.1